MMTWSQLGFQDSNSPVMEEFVFFHDFTMVILTGILVFVAIIMAGSALNLNIGSSLLEGQVVECIWTLIPAFILVQIAMPSLVLLYLLDEGASNALSVKATGHQWYWSYEYSDFWANGKAVEFDAYLDRESEQVRLLDTDNVVAVPTGASIRVLVGSADVLHAWTLPSMGVKVDACPGRLNQLSFTVNRPGVVFGQCSEICGANHSFMPIRVEAGSPKDFVQWVETQLI